MYMHQPKGFTKRGEENLVWKLDKSIYGLKQSGQVWHETMRREMERISFTPRKADPTIYIWLGNNGEIGIAGWFVDNGLPAANSIEMMAKIVMDIKGSFNIEDLGEPTQLLGIKISRNHELGTIHISQPSFIDTIAKWFKISLGHGIHAALIGSVNYCVVSTCPDITYTTNKCTQYASKPNVWHWEVVKRIIRYLLQTKEYGISYQREGQGIKGYAHSLAGFTDVNFTGNKDNPKSTSSWLFTISGAPILWASKKQQLMSRSSMESKLIAGSFTSAEGMWLNKLGC